MLPQQLNPANFSGYPPEARTLAIDQLAVLRRLPLPFVPLLLRELIAYDWKFPAERRSLNEQFRFLNSLSAEDFAREIAPFAALRLGPEFESIDWVNRPVDFSEKLSAHLWATHQHDAFRAASVEYVNRVDAAQKAEEPGTNRLALVVIGQGVETAPLPLFRKLRPFGVHFTNVAPENGLNDLRAMASERAAKHPEPFAHWYIDGGHPSVESPDSLACISYGSLDPIRLALISKMRRIMQPGGGGSEVLRSVLAQITPRDLGMPESAGSAAVLDRFRISILTEGSGTQLFSTTFVQWSAREALRRAQPVTLLARFAPRQREDSMKELLAGTSHQPVPDPAGSLVDADMAAFYTYLNLQRLSGADRSGFLVWFEDHSEALAIGPNLGKAHIDAGRVTMRDLVGRIA
jgi:hypothetical protein